MSDPVAPVELAWVEPAADPGGRGDVAQAVPGPVREAARRVLAQDGHAFHLQPWQVAWLVATSEGREGVVPIGCGVGKGWLQARLDEAIGAGQADAEG